MKISLIAAVAKNGVIGNQGKLPWNIPDDLARFKSITTGHHILMGKNTHESIGRVLPDRTNIVISKPKMDIPDAYVFDDPEDGVEFARSRGEEELFVIGGGMIYDYFLQYADKIYLTKILNVFKGDTYFPNINQMVFKQSTIEKHRNSDPPYDFLILEKK